MNQSIEEDIFTFKDFRFLVTRVKCKYLNANFPKRRCIHKFCRIFFLIFGGHISFLWSPCFGFLVMSVLGFMDSLACFLARVLFLRFTSDEVGCRGSKK